ncbi:MAG TPA: ABC transporter permease [Micropepsaceae bacterium]|nr:ABC transporter permease [Micropepsaceae bacterium]
MTFGATLSTALGALLRNKMRSFLTALGVVIGVAAVVIMQAMGQGATAYVGEAISGLGSNMLVAEPGSPRNFNPHSSGIPMFTMADVEAIRRQAHDVARLVPINTRSLRVVYGANNRNVNAGGVTTDYFVIRQWNVVAGRLPSAEDNRRTAQICVIGETVRDKLFGTQDPIGLEMRVHDISCRVVGVLESKGTSTFGIDQDDVVFLPFTTFSRRIMGTDRVAMIMFSPVAADRLDSVKRDVTAILHVRRHILAGEDDDFAVRDPREIQSLLESVTSILTLVLAGVAAISLVVGGIGIMNIMLVSVTERTREIGIRLAVGARANDILAQFLVEAVVISSLGGLAGLGLGAAGAYAVAKVINVPYVVPGVAMPIAFAVSVLVGVIFGVFPARRASRLNPLSALRFE